MPTMMFAIFIKIIQSLRSLFRTNIGTVYISNYIRGSLANFHQFQISVPPSCLKTVAWNNDNNELTPTNFVPNVNPPTDNSLSNTASCYYAGRTYEDGAQWMSTEVNNLVQRIPD